MRRRSSPSRALLAVCLLWWFSLTPTILAQSFFGCGSDDCSASTPLGALFGLRINTCPASNCDNTGVLQHHFTDNISGASVACFASGTPLTSQDNGYLRCFPGSLCSEGRIVEAVNFWVQRLEGSSLPVTVRLYKSSSSSDCSSTANVALLYQQGPIVSSTVTVEPGVNFAVTVPLTGEPQLAPSESLLVEVSAPTMEGVGRFTIGDSNEANQCGPSYLQTNSCGATNLPIPTSVIDQGQFASVAHMISVQTRPLPAPVPTPSPTTGPPIPVREPTCFDSIDVFFGCAVRYLFGWLLPF